MGITDKVSGKTKQVVGDLTGNPETRREGKQEERKGEKKEELHRAQERPSLVPRRRRRSEAGAA